MNKNVSLSLADFREDGENISDSRKLKKNFSSSEPHVNSAELINKLVFIPMRIRKTTRNWSRRPTHCRPTKRAKPSTTADAKNRRRRKVGGNLSDAAILADIAKRFSSNTSVKKKCPAVPHSKDEWSDNHIYRKKSISTINPHKILGESGSWSPFQKKNDNGEELSKHPLFIATDKDRRRMSRSLKIKKWVKECRNNEVWYENDKSNGKHRYAQSEDRYPLAVAKAAAQFKDSSISNFDRTLNIINNGVISAAKRRQQWISEFSSSTISSDSSCCDDFSLNDIEIKSRTDAFDHLENPTFVRQRRLNALKDKLSSKGQSFEIIDLLSSKKEKELLELIHTRHTRVVLDVCLLWCCVHGDKAIISYFLKLGANPEAIDAEGFSAMHLLAENNSAETIHILAVAGARLSGCVIWDNKKEFTQLMLAARAGNLETIEALISQGADVNIGINCSKETALHFAVKGRHVKCVNMLISAGAGANTLTLYSETALHIAVSEGYIELVEILLEAGADVRASKGNNRMASLHLAAQEGHNVIMRMLLDSGADYKQVNARGQTALHIAARAQSADAVQELLRCGSDSNARDQDGKTPLHTGIFKGSRCYECLKLLVEANADPNAADIAGYTPLHLAALHDSSYCVQMFLKHGGDVSARTKGGISALNIILRKTPLGLTCLQEILDASIVQDDRDHHREGDVQMQLDFRVFKGEKGREPECRLLTCFVEERQRLLLKHPLCESFIYLKWQQVRSFFIVNLIYYSLLVLTLTIFIHFSFPGTCFCEILFFQQRNSSSDPICPFDVKNEQHGNYSLEIEYDNDVGSVKKILIYLIWCLLGALSVKEFTQFVDTPKSYISSLDNILIWPIILFSFLITTSGYIHDFKGESRSDWEYHIAAYLLLLAWIELLLMVGRFPLCGLYVQMFARVIQNFGKFLLTYVCLINAFSLSFGVLFHNHSAFKCHLLRLLKTLVMMTGEVEYDDFFFDEPEILYPGTAHIIFAIFLVFCTIILMNLLVGLAVSDIQGLQQSAGLDRLVRQTQLIASLELLLFSKWMSFTVPPSLLKVIRNRVLLLPTMYSRKLTLATKNINGHKLESELLESIHRIARAREHSSRRRNAFASFRSMSHAAHYGPESETSRSIEAIHCGLELLVRESETRKSEAKQMKESVITVLTQLEILLSRTKKREESTNEENEDQ